MTSLQPMLAFLLVAAAVQGQEIKPNTTAQAAAQVSGTVYINGKPLPVGWITFHGKGAKDTVQATINDGQYALKSVPPGPHRITVDTTGVAVLEQQLKQQLMTLERRAALLKMAKKDDAELAKRIAEMKERLKTAEQGRKRLVKVPEKFGKLDTSELALEVKPGEQTFNIELKD